MKKMTNRDAAYASRKFHELLRLVSNLLVQEADELIAKSELMAAEAIELMKASNELRSL